MEDAKNVMRRAFLAKRRALPADFIREKSALIAARLMLLPQFAEAEVVMCYSAMRDEVQTYGIIKRALKEGKKVCIPYIRGAGLMDAAQVKDMADLTEGTFGILTVRQDRLRAVDPADISAVVLPGVAFGRRGERLGMGAGFYDRFLPKARRAAFLAPAFSCQIGEGIPVMPYDCFADFIITEDEIIHCKGAVAK